MGGAVEAFELAVAPRAAEATGSLGTLGRSGAPVPQEVSPTGERGYWIGGALMALLTLGSLALVFVVFAMWGAISLKLIVATTGCFIA